MKSHGNRKCASGMICTKMWTLREAGKNIEHLSVIGMYNCHCIARPCVYIKLFKRHSPQKIKRIVIKTQNDTLSIL